MSFYPPGVTGNEYAISGPEWEREIEGECPNGHAALWEEGHDGHIWQSCAECDWVSDDLGPERAMDAADAAADRILAERKESE